MYLTEFFGGEACVINYNITRQGMPQPNSQIVGDPLYRFLRRLLQPGHRASHGHRNNFLFPVRVASSVGNAMQEMERPLQGRGRQLQHVQRRWLDDAEGHKCFGFYRTGAE